MSCDALILAAGENTRLQGIVPPFMKPLMLVNGKPLVRHAIDHAMEWGAKHAVIVVSPDNASLIPTVVPHVGVHWVLQPRAEGVVDAIRRGMHAVKSDMTLILCADNTFDHSQPQSELLGIVERREASFGSRVLNLRAAARFTQWTPRTDTPGVHIVDTNADNAGHSLTGNCWIGPLLLKTDMLQQIFTYSPSVPRQTIASLIRNATNDGHDLRPLPMECADMGTIAAVTP